MSKKIKGALLLTLSVILGLLFLLNLPSLARIANPFQAIGALLAQAFFGWLCYVCFTNGRRLLSDD